MILKLRHQNSTSYWHIWKLIKESWVIKGQIWQNSDVKNPYSVHRRPKVLNSFWYFKAPLHLYFSQFGRISPRNRLNFEFWEVCFILIPYSELIWRNILLILQKNHGGKNLKLSHCDIYIDEFFVKQYQHWTFKKEGILFLCISRLTYTIYLYSVEKHKMHSLHTFGKFFVKSSHSKVH